MGAAMILAAIHTMQNTLVARLDGIDTRLDDIETRLSNIDTQLEDIQRETARNGNIVKGVGRPFAYTEVTYTDGTRPTAAALPALTNVDDIRGLSWAQAGSEVE
ncbi:hypothetical protein B0H14DRAFT_3459424 [Mycena olivaceomarginata]|nr:hypothetical protein B0H14DRAFT_3459424 [Mycena olivaceomarginata]